MLTEMNNCVIKKRITSFIGNYQKLVQWACEIYNNNYYSNLCRPITNNVYYVLQCSVLHHIYVKYFAICRIIYIYICLHFISINCLYLWPAIKYEKWGNVIYVYCKAHKNCI